MQFLHDPTHLPACEAGLGYRDLAAVYQEFAGKKDHWETQADLRVRACACVCVCVCMLVCMCVCLCVCACACACVCMCVCVCVCECVCVRVYGTRACIRAITPKPFWLLILSTGGSRLCVRQQSLLISTRRSRTVLQLRAQLHIHLSCPSTALLLLILTLPS